MHREYSRTSAFSLPNHCLFVSQLLILLSPLCYSMYFENQHCFVGMQTVDVEGQGGVACARERGGPATRRHDNSCQPPPRSGQLGGRRGCIVKHHRLARWRHSMPCNGAILYATLCHTTLWPTLCYYMLFYYILFNGAILCCFLPWWRPGAGRAGRSAASVGRCSGGHVGIPQVLEPKGELLAICGAPSQSWARGKFNAEIGLCGRLGVTGCAGCWGR